MLTTSAPTAATLQPDADQVARFVRCMFKYAKPGDIASLRAFRSDTGRALFIRDFDIEDDGLASIITGAVHGARDAAKARGVFSPPIATFKTTGKATEANLAAGFCITVECDSRPQWALETLLPILGPPTLTVASGGIWIDPATGEIEDKLHLHWRLAVPADNPDALARLKVARRLACAIVGADPSCVPIVHPLRWPGSWHLKREPRLCRIVEETEHEIDLDAALVALREAAPADVVEAADRVPGSRKSDFSESPKSARTRSQASGSRRVKVDELREALAFCPNDFGRDERWTEWTNTGIRIWVLVDGDFDLALDLFDGWSQRAAGTDNKGRPLYDAKRTRQRMTEIAKSKPNRTDGHLIFKIAQANGWRTKPTHEASAFTDIEAARREIARVIHNFLHPNVWQAYANECLGSSAARALRVETGAGKTDRAIREAVNFSGRIGYGVSQHKLSGEIEQRFRDQGVNAATYRGREYQIDDDTMMCAAPEKIEHAKAARINIEKACCKHGNKVCEFYDTCAFQLQKPAIRDAKVVIYASDMIFHTQPAIGKLDAQFIDESFTFKQIANPIVVSLTELIDDDDAELARLARELMAQPHDGPLEIRYAIGISDPHRLRNRLLAEKPVLEFHPGMTASAMRSYARRNKKLIKRAALFRNLADMLPDLAMMEIDSIKVSGRLWLATEDGERLLCWRGTREITKQFDVPTLLMDATLPPLELLRLTHSRVRQVADIRIAMPPSVHITQILGAPTSKNKLISGPHVEKHQSEIVRYITKRWLECERGPALVICQKEFEDKVLRKALPQGIEVLHFNDLAGVDAYKDVRLCIIVGRTLPKSDSIEGLAGILTGVTPECAVVDHDDDDVLRYDRVKRGIRLRDGTGRAVFGHQHPDELCEAIRWLCCEGELVQAIGRPRGINRTPDTPLDIDLLFDEVLPIEVDDVDNWERPSLYYATASEGVMLESPTDMHKVWPDVFENLIAAKRVAAKGVPVLPGFTAIRYQAKGKGKPIHVAYFDLAVIADPLAWLTDRLGPVIQRAAP